MIEDSFYAAKYLIQDYIVSRWRPFVSLNVWVKAQFLERNYYFLKDWKTKMRNYGDTIAENIGDNSVSEVVLLESSSLSPVKRWLILLPNSMILIMLMLKLLTNYIGYVWNMTFVLMKLQLLLYKLIARKILGRNGSQRTSKEK